MSTTATHPAPTRMVVMGPAVLAHGFGLAGFETWPDARPEDVDRVLNELLAAGAPALVLLEHALCRRESAALTRARREGGRIVIAEIPPLHDPAGYRPAVEDLFGAIAGPEAERHLP